MLWEISPDAAVQDAVRIRTTSGECFTAPLPLESAIEIVNEHNRAVERALAAGLGITEG